MENTTIVIADDHPLYRDALEQALDGIGFACTIKMAANLEETKETLYANPGVDLVMLDLSMPGVSGFSGLAQLRAEFPAIAVVVVSATEDPVTIRGCMELGASGFIPKSSATEIIRHGVKEVLSGEIYLPESAAAGDNPDPETIELFQKIKSLTPQQAKVLGMLGDGLLNKQIAYELGVSEATVKAHVSAVLLKLGVDSRTQAVITLNKLGSGILSTSG